MTSIPGKPTATKPQAQPQEVVEPSTVLEPSAPDIQPTVEPPPVEEAVPTSTSNVSSDVDGKIQLKMASPQAVEKLKKIQAGIREKRKRRAILKTREERLQLKKEEISRNRASRYRQGINSVFLDMLDLPGDTVSLILNHALKTPGDIGETEEIVPSGGFRELSRVIGKEISEMPEGMAKSFLSNIGFETAPEDVFGNQGALERTREYERGRLMGEAMAFTIMSPALSRLKANVPTIGPVQTREKIKAFIKGAGDVAVKHPIQTAVVETLGAGGAVIGLAYGQHKYPDSAAAQFLLSATGGATLSLQTPRTIFRFGEQYATQKFLNRFGGPAAFRTAQKQLHKRLGSEEEAREALLNLQDVDKDAPGFRQLASPAELTRSQPTINFQTAFFRTDEAQELGEFKRWRAMHDLLIELGQTPASARAGNVEDAIESSIESIKFLLEERLNTVRLRLLKQADALKENLTPESANILAKQLILDEMEIAEESLRALWNDVDLTAATPTGAVTSTFERLIKEVTEEEGTAIFKLGDEDSGGDLFKFLGKFHKTRAKKAVKATKTKPAQAAVPSKIIFKPGKWGKEVSLKRIQSLRSRILRVVREERAKPAPNTRKISVLTDLQESMRHAMSSIDGPVADTEAYRIAVRATEQVRTRFNEAAIAKILRVGRHGDIVPAGLTLENIFTGAGKAEAATGAEIFESILKSLEGGSPDAPFELIGAAEQLIKYRFRKEVVHNGVVNVGKAETFIQSHKRLLNSPVLQGVKADMDELVKTGNLAKFKDLKNTQLTKHVDDPKLSMAAFYVGNGPKKTFNEMLKIRQPKKLDAALVDLLDKVKSNPDAKDGLDGHFFMWLLDEASVKQIMNLKTPEILSGFKLRQTWELPNTQKMAKAILSKERRDMMEKIIHSSETLDMILHAHASQGGTFDLEPNILIERLLRYAALRFSPLPSGGGGSIAAHQLLSENVRDTFRSRYKDPALHILYDAFLNKNEELMKSLFMNVQDQKSAQIVMKQVNSWMAATLFSAGERAVNEEEE